MEKESFKIGILGLGLIGGSILKALNLLGKYTLVAVSKSSYKVSAEFADISGNDISLLARCDMVFVCSKMNETSELFKKLENVVTKDCIVADVCSLKGFLEGAYKFNYVPTHPMAGSEFSGFEGSDPYLFEGAKWILGKQNGKVEEIIREMGAIPLILSAAEHDKFAAEISHLPAMISFALFNSASNGSKKIASSGFRDTTRLSMTNPDLAFDMLSLNRENILAAYKKFNLELEKILNMNEGEFKEFALNVAKRRQKMYDKNGKNVF